MLMSSFNFGLHYEKRMKIQLKQELFIHPQNEGRMGEVWSLHYHLLSISVRIIPLYSVRRSRILFFF